MSRISPETLQAILARIVESVQPEKVILFGSAARTGMSGANDLDFLVIKSGEYHHLDLAQSIYDALGRRTFGIDITVATPEEVERFKDQPWLVLYAALRDGKVLYDAKAA